MARIRSDRRTALTIAALLSVTAALAAATDLLQPAATPQPRQQRRRGEQAEQTRPLLFHAIQPVKLANCQLERFGESHDGGYLLCRNLLGGVRSGYSYGISGYDQWGCDVSTRLGIAVHEYDCFDLRRPACDRGRTIFHPECIGGRQRSDGGRLFDTLAAQVSRNGDAGKHLVVKMDVEGAEWDSLLATPDELLQVLDQLVIEFHGFDQPRYLALVSKLKHSFYVVNLHWNNFGCRWGRPPFPSLTYEVLLVNRRIGVPDPAGRAALPNPLDQANAVGMPDCQLQAPPRPVAAHEAVGVAVSRP